MKIGVLSPKNSLLSIRIYAEHIVEYLESRGVEVVHFLETGPLPQEVDLYWDPRSSGGKAPKPILKDVKKPLVVTVHGAGPFSIPGNEYFPNLKERLKGRINKVRDYRNWQNRKGWCSAFIAVSEYCKWEISKYFSLDEKMITPIYHGKNEALFKPSISKDQSEEPFLLHVSSYQPKKNVGRIIEAYGMIESQDKPKLKLIVPGFKQQDVPAGVELVTEKKRPEEIAHLLQQAMGFVFPSTHETFGLPIIEAMACGCPVITSNTTACKEIGGDAAILVNPKSVIDIKDAMTKLIGDKSLREKMSRDSLRRAADFSWQKSGAEHLEVFKLVLAENPGLSKS